MTTAQLTTTRTQGPLRGVNVLMTREGRKWWRTRRWWVQALIWVLLLDGFITFGLYVMPSLIEQSTAEMAQAAQNGVEMMTAAEFQRDVPHALFGLASLLLPIGVILLVQGQVWVEKRFGITAWILSKPVGRPAYLLAKLLTDALGILLTMLVLPLGLGYLLLRTVLPIMPETYLTAAALLLLLLVFYQTFTLMMSVVADGAELVTGAAIGLLMGGLLLKDVLAQLIGSWVFVTPWALPDVIALVISGYPLPQEMHVTVIALPLWTLVCLILAFWRFNRQEL